MLYLLFMFFLMIRRPPRSTRTDTPFPTRRSSDLRGDVVDIVGDVRRRGAFEILGIEHGERGRGAETVALDAAAGDGDRRVGIGFGGGCGRQDRKSTRLNSSH